MNVYYVEENFLIISLLCVLIYRCGRNVELARNVE